MNMVGTDINVDTNGNSRYFVLEKPHINMKRMKDEKIDICNIFIGVFEIKRRPELCIHWNVENAFIRAVIKIQPFKNNAR